MRAHADLAQKLRDALELEQQGKLAQAEAIFGEILTIEAMHPDALQHLGSISCQTGQYERAIQLLSRALSLNPDIAALHVTLGAALDGLGRLDEAVASYDKAITLEPNLAKTHNARGNALQKRGRLDEAVVSYRRAVSLDPGYTGACYNLGNTLQMLGRSAEAVASYNAAVAMRPDYAEAFNNRGIALSSIRRFEEAVASYDRAIVLRSDYVAAHVNRGIALIGLKRPDEALASLDKAAALMPDHAGVHYNRGIALADLGRLDEAAASYAETIALSPDYAEAHSNRGLALHGLNRLDEALASYDRAIALRPDLGEVHNSRGLVLHDLNRPDAALVSYDKAFALKPELVEAHWNKSLMLLALGRFDEGWPLLEWRKRLPEPLGADAYPQPLWLGAESLAGKTIFLHWEQGLGDTIQFCRYANLVQARGARVVMSVQDALLRLMKPLEPQIEIIGGQTPPAAFDFHAPLMSLPLAFGTTLETIPAEPRYLAADPDLAANWAARLPPRTRPRIGLVWSGSTTHKNDHNRSIALRELQPLLSFDADWVCLQKEIRERDAPALQQHGAIHVFGEALGDFADTAALIEQLDLVITVDTSTAHLAGALGKPVWVLLPFMPDFRWLLDRQDCPWYPSARLFRQPRVGDWASVIDHLADEAAARFR